MAVNYSLLEKYKPRSAVWEITLQCNLSCLHCGSSATTQKRNDELSTSEAMNLIHDLKELGNKRMVLSGGEPLLRKDWYDLGKELRSLDIDTAIISNGYAIGRDEIRKIKELELYAMGLSIDGLAETHDFVRGREGSFNKNIQTITKLKSEGVPVSINTAVNHKNIDDLIELRDLFLEKGVDAWQLQVAAPFGRMGTGETKHMMVSKAEYIALANFIVNTKRDFPEIAVGAADCIGYYYFKPGVLYDFSWKGCQAGIQGIGIESDGAVKGCLSLREEFIEDNIRNRSLKDIWCDEDSFDFTRNFDIDSLEGACNDCEYGQDCRGGCTVTVNSFQGKLGDNPLCLHSLAKEGWYIR